MLLLPSADRSGRVDCSSVCDQDRSAVGVEGKPLRVASKGVFSFSSFFFFFFLKREKSRGLVLPCKTFPPPTFGCSTQHLNVELQLH